MARDGKGWQGMARDGKGWQGMARDGKGWQGMARDGKGRQGHARPLVTLVLVSQTAMSAQCVESCDCLILLNACFSIHIYSEHVYCMYVMNPYTIYIYIYT